MSSWKKAAKTGQKTHRERHQPEAREYLGLLEKKKDYKLRANDYNDKQAALRLLRKRALNKNPDEFYFHMINSKLRNGVHREKDRKEEYTPEQIKLMETQDLTYISHKRNIESKKVEKLQTQLHLLDAANVTKNKHIFFVDDTKEEKQFDIAKKLDTHPDLVERRTNRPRLSKIKNMKMPELSKSTLAKIEQQKHMAYSELRKRVEREHELTIVQEKMEASRAIKKKGLLNPKTIRQGSKVAAPVYKWPYVRQK